MYVVFANIHALPEHREDYLRTLLTHAEDTRAEPGCVRFDVLQDNEDSNCFRLYEVFRDQAAHDTHSAIPSTSATLSKLAEWRERPTVLHYCTNLSPTDSSW